MKTDNLKDLYNVFLCRQSKTVPLFFRDFDRANIRNHKTVGQICNRKTPRSGEDSTSRRTPLPSAISFPLPVGFGICTRWKYAPSGAQLNTVAGRSSCHRIMHICFLFLITIVFPALLLPQIPLTVSFPYRID